MPHIKHKKEGKRNLDKLADFVRKSPGRKSDNFIIGTLDKPKIWKSKTPKRTKRGRVVITAVSTESDTPTQTNHFLSVPSVIEFVRRKLGWSQYKLARKMGTSQPVIARAERFEKEGKWTKLSLRFYMRFCKATGTTMTAPSFRDITHP